jgi:hypothetical protein
VIGVNARVALVRELSHGRDFATALAEQGGNAAVDTAFRRPPASTAQVIDPKA